MQRAYRLRRSADFQRVRGLKRSWAHPLLVLYMAPNEVGHPRIGVTVSRRIGKAVVRNRVRRRIREAVRHVLADRGSGLAGASADLLFIARDRAATAEWTELRTAVDELLRRARLSGSRLAQPPAGT